MENKISEFGKFCRKLRIENDMILKEMADSLEVSSSYLSAVENGKRNIPNEWIAKIVKIFNLDESQEQQLLVTVNTNEILFSDFGITKSDDKELLIQFARKCNGITPEKFKKVMEIIGKEESDES